MECRKFKINLISASGLENVCETFRMKVYAAVTIGGNQKTEKKTPVDKQNETNPAWNCTFEYVVGEEAVLQEGVMLAIKLHSKRPLADRYVGEVHVSLKELFDKAAAEKGRSAVFNYKVRRGGSAEGQGELKFSCSFDEKVEIQQPSRWKKVLSAGAMILLNVTVNVAFGVDIQVPLFC